MAGINSEIQTNWSEYYSTPFPASKLTRHISAQKVIKLIRIWAGETLGTIAEIGGGNSYFVDYFLQNFKIHQYVVFDNCDQALLKFENRFRAKSSITSQLIDVREIEDCQNFDSVFSIGLIEHFDASQTCRAIESHFKLCRPGGIVLISFPTPTPLYRLIRGVAEILGIWKFPDERPLHFKEVIACGSN